MSADLKQRIYEVIETNFMNTQRYAKLIFNVTYDKNEFKKCEFDVGDRKFYTLEDWKFLNEVSKSIMELEGKEK